MACKVPIGLIDASQGGTTVEAWTPEDVLRKIDGKETRDMLKDWDDKMGTWKSTARHDDFSHGYKSFETAAVAPKHFRSKPLAYSSQGIV